MDGLTPNEALDHLDLTGPNLKELITLWAEQVTGLNRQFLPMLHNGSIDYLVAGIRALPGTRKRGNGW